MHQGLRLSFQNLKTWGIQGMLHFAFLELMPETVDQVRWLPKLEVQVGDSLIVNVYMKKRDRTIKQRPRRLASYCLKAVESQIQLFNQIAEMPEDPTFKYCLERFRIKAALEGLASRIGGSISDLDEDLATLLQMKRVLTNIGAVSITRSQHDQGFLDSLNSSKRLRRIAGW